MNDLFNLPIKNSCTVFTAKGSDYQIWNKPSGTKFVHIFCLGSGAGGAGGNITTGTISRFGGSGGGAGGYSSGIYLSDNLPDKLFLFIASGGAGGAGATGAVATQGSDGLAGDYSYVSVESNTTTMTLLLRSSNTVALGGLKNAGSPGTAAAAWTGSILSNLGINIFSPGVQGGIGCTTTNLTPLTVTKIVTGGTGGGSNSGASVFNGGTIQGPAWIAGYGGGSVSSGVGLNGLDGYCSNISNPYNSNIGVLKYPFSFSGGTGGGCSMNNSGGNGGNGAYGCGGGGGGGGAVNFTGGNGGKGGDGLIIITSW